MHETPPYAATEIAHLFGGPFDGEAWSVPLHTTELHIPIDPAETQHASYYFCPVNTLYYQKPTYRSADLIPPTIPE